MTSIDTANPDPPKGTTIVLERWAMGDWASHLRLWSVAVIGLAADLWTKDWAFRTLQAGESREIIRNLCSFRISLNPGALFGIGAGLAPVFVGASILALMFVLYLFAQSTISRRSMHIGLGLVLAGAIGNLYDRTTQSAHVLHFASGGRVIGTLLKETEDVLIVGDYPSGGNPQRFARSAVQHYGLEPVVRDFIQIEAKIGSFTLWPWIFNIADALLVVGVGLLLLNFWFDRHEQPERRDDASEPVA